MFSISLENHRCEDICSPFSLKIINSGKCVFNPPVLDPRRTYVPNICFNYIDNAYARDDRGPSHHLWCQRLEIWGLVSAFPVGNLQFDYIYRRSVLKVIDSRTHVLVPPRKSQLGEHISSLALQNYSLETTCPRLPLLELMDFTTHALVPGRNS